MSQISNLLRAAGSFRFAALTSRLGVDVKGYEFGASFLKLIGFGLSFTAKEAGLLILGCVVSFGVSVLAIKFLMGYIKNHDFKVFGYYRIVLGAIIIIAAIVQMIIA